MNSQVNSSVAFKRFAKATTADQSLNFMTITHQHADTTLTNEFITGTSLHIILIRQATNAKTITQ